MADNKIIIELQSKDSATGQITSSVREMEVSLKSLEGSGAGAFASINSGMNSSISSIAGWVAALGGAALAINTIKTAFTEGIRAAEEFNLKTIGIGAALTNMAETGQGSFKEIFERNAVYAGQMYEAMRKEAASHFASASDMMAAYNILVQKGYAVRVDEVKYLGILADKIKLATEGQDYQVQVNQEIRSLMEGQATAHSAIGQELKARLGPAWAEIVENHKKAGTLLKYLADLWPGIEAATAQVTNTITAQNTTLQGNLKYVGKEGLAGAYEDVVDVLKRMNLYLEQHGEKLSKDIAAGWNNIRDAILAIPDAMKKAVEGTISFAKELKAISENPIIMAFLGAAAGGRLGPWGAATGALAGGMYATSNIRQSAQERAYETEFGGYEIPMREQQKSWISKLGQTNMATKDDLQGAISTGTKDGIEKSIEIIAQRLGVGQWTEVIKAMAQQESGMRQTTGKGGYVISPAGAVGVMQLMPGTARGLGVDPYDLQQNIYGGIMYFKQMLAQFNNDVYRAVAAYNAGPNREALRAGGPLDVSRLPAETRGYLKSVFGAGRGWKEMEQGVSDQERAAADAEKEKEKAEEKWQKYLEKVRKQEFKDLERETSAARAMAEKDQEDNLKRYLEMINHKKKLDTEAKDWSINALHAVIEDESMSYGQRIAAAKQFKELRLAMLDEEISKLKEKFGGRISEDVLASYKKAMTDKISSDLKKSTNEQAFSWESAWKRAAENVQDAMSTMFESLFTGDKGKIAKSFGQGLIKMLSNQLSQGVMSGLKHAGSMISGFFKESSGGGAADTTDKMSTAADQLGKAGLQLDLAGLQSLAAAGSLGLAGIGILTGSQELMMAATALSVVATLLQMAAAMDILPFHGGGVVAHGGLLVAHGGLTLGSDERLIKAQTDEWILRRSAVRSLRSKGVSFDDLNNGNLPAGGGADVLINHTYAPVINRRLNQSDYNQDAQKMFNALERERRRRGR
jgi:hypothetical protein